MTAEKYEIIKNDSIVHNGRTLYRIRALRDFITVNGRTIKKGDLGGFVQTEDNLSQEGTCWIFDNAKVYDNAVICDKAEVYGNAEVFENAEIYDYAFIFGNAKVFDNAKISGNAQIFGKSRVYGNAEVYENATVFNDAKICDNAKIYGNAIICGRAKVYDCAEVNGIAEIYDNALVCDNAKIYGYARIFGIAKIGGDKIIEKGNYVFKSFTSIETLNKVEIICEKVDFASKAVKSNFPVEKSYIENLISQFAEYSELTKFLCHQKYYKYVNIFPEVIEIYALLLQGKANVEILKN